MSSTLHTIFILLVLFFHIIQGLDICEDKSTDCQPCNFQYPVPLPTRGNCMETCQVCTNKNVALRQTTRQSSMDYSGESKRAVDGKTNGVYFSGSSCTHTEETSGTQWWCVDLKRIYNIKNITMYNRVDYGGERLEGFELKTSSSGQCNEAGFTTSSLCYKNDPPTNKRVYTIDRCNQDSNKSIVAGTLFVSVTGKVLTICEFQVFIGTCSPGYFNTSDSTCEPCDGCSVNKCNPDTGDCIDVCKSGFFGNKCDQNCTGCLDACTKDTGDCIGECKFGFYGNKCDQSCTGCLEKCVKDTGDCIGECKQGLYGTRCNETCSDGCSKKNCSMNGSCSCRNGFYGAKCSFECSSNCTNSSCTSSSPPPSSPPPSSSPPPPSSSPRCTDGCVDGYKGSYCQTPCDVNCIRCDVVNCTECKPGWYGDNCESNCHSECSDGKPVDTSNKVQEDAPSYVTIAVSVTMVLLVVIVVIVVVFFLKRRKKKHCKEENTSFAINTNDSSVQVITERSGKAKANVDVYENVVCTEDRSVYQNDDVVAPSTTRINLKDLMDYIKRHNSIDDEFQSLPSGLCSSYDYGMNPVNKPKNRYKAVCAFDHSRVKLDIENDDLYSDYINACYITGFNNVDRKYIASQGPVSAMVVEFWRMVWIVDAGKIVMLTNLQEIGVQKCFQYWPQMGKFQLFGKITVTVIEEKVFSYFTLRKFKVEKEGWDPRYVEQFHYTAWPDKSIPRDIPSLLEFTYKVNETPSSLTGPLVVHCSAGIGRTGTFIGLDYLIEEGKKMESVDVFKCVEQMRYERVNMVQTMKQYVFLHQALAVAFVADGVISVKSYREDIGRLINNDRNTIKMLFKKLESVSPIVTNERFKAALLEENKHKNRDMSVFPLDEFRLYLSYRRENSSDYINAVPLPSYRKKSGYIITQTPLQETVADFWKMLVEAEVEIVVNMDSTESHDNVGDYVPENGQLVVGDFKVTKLDEKLNDNGFYSVLTLSVEDKNNVDFKKTITFSQCRFWKPGNTTPTEVSPILALLDDVQSTSSHTDNNGPPIAVMCLNGAAKSGLFCVLAAVIERLNIEQRVNVLLTILQLRLYRPQIVTSPGQLQFCIDAVNEYVEKYSTYVNSV